MPQRQDLIGKWRSDRDGSFTLGSAGTCEITALTSEAISGTTEHSTQKPVTTPCTWRVAPVRASDGSPQVIVTFSPSRKGATKGTWFLVSDDKTLFKTLDDPDLDHRITWRKTANTSS